METFDKSCSLCKGCNGIERTDYWGWRTKVFRVPAPDSFPMNIIEYKEGYMKARFL